MSINSPESLNGILLLDKPKGLSSNQAIQRIKRHFKLKKVGHTGTLDPMATGMLPVCLNETTKLASLLLSDSKTYTFEVTLGQRTDTGDADGEVIESAPIPNMSLQCIADAMSQFLGEQQQQPPMYSALKHQGKPLYEYARKGKEIARESRAINIHMFELLEHSGDSIKASVKCSSGTYVRVLAEDLANKLGTIGHLTSLRRDSISCFDDDSMMTEDQLFSDGFDLSSNLIDHSTVSMALPKLSVNEEVKNRLQHGQRILQTDAMFPEGVSDYLVYRDDHLIGIGSVALTPNQNWALKLRKVIK